MSVCSNLHVHFFGFIGGFLSFGGDFDSVASSFDTIKTCEGTWIIVNEKKNIKKLAQSISKKAGNNGYYYLVNYLHYKYSRLIMNTEHPTDADILSTIEVAGIVTNNVEIKKISQPVSCEYLNPLFSLPINRSSNLIENVCIVKCVHTDESPWIGTNCQQIAINCLSKKYF